MDIKIFSLANEDVLEHDTCLAALRDAQDRMSEVHAAFIARAAAQQRFAEDRKNTLRAIINDSSRTETARTMAQKELAAIDATTCNPTQSELDEYAAAKEAAYQALADLREVRKNLQISLNGLSNEIEKAKVATLNSPNIDMNWMQRQLDEDKGLTA